MLPGSAHPIRVLSSMCIPTRIHILYSPYSYPVHSLRCARRLHAECKQQDARCVLRMARAHNARASSRHAEEYRQVIHRPCIHTAPNTRHQHRAQGNCDLRGCPTGGCKIACRTTGRDANLHFFNVILALACSQAKSIDQHLVGLPTSMTCRAPDCPTALTTLCIAKQV